MLSPSHFACVDCDVCTSTRARLLRSDFRAQGLSRLAVAPTLPRAQSFPGPRLDSSEHDGTLDVVGMTLSRGARLLGARIAPHACIRRAPYDPNHDAVMRIGSEAPRRRTILSVGIKAMLQAGTPLPRTVIADPSQERADGAETD